VVLVGIATPPGRRRREAVMTVLAPILEAFFTDRLMTQRGASPHTIAPTATPSPCCSATSTSRPASRNTTA